MVHPAVAINSRGESIHSFARSTAYRDSDATHGTVNPASMCQ